jgi:hypothetical protein
LSATTILLIVLLVVAIIMCSVAVWALIEMVKTARSTRELSDETRERLIPLLDKADITVDAINAELYRIDGIITTFETAGERVESASGTISDIVNTPGELVNEFAGRVRRAFNDRRRAAEEKAAQSAAQQETEPSPQAEEPQAPVTEDR